MRRLALLGLVVAVLAGCGGGSGGTITIQPARQFTLDFTSKGNSVTFRIVQPDGKPLTKFRQGSGPHTGVHLIYVRRDLGVIVHHHPPIGADGTIHDTPDLPEPGPYRVVVDAYPQQTTPQANFQLFAKLTKPGAYTPRPLPPTTTAQTIDGYRFTLTKAPKLKAIEPALITVRVTAPDGSAPRFTPWFGALAHAIFFRKGTLDYFHTHVCAPGAEGCTSTLGGTNVTGTSATPGKLDVGVLVPVAGTWRLFLQIRVHGKVLSAPFTLSVS